MPKYTVSMRIYNRFVVEADNEDEAEEKVYALSLEDTLDCADYEVVEVEEIKS